MTESKMTPVELEVWRAVQALNRTWTSGRPDDLAQHLHPEITAVTPSDRDPLLGREAAVASWRRFVETATIHAARELEPRVRVFGDAAVVSYRYELDCEIGGRNLTLAGRDLFYMARQGGRWLAVGDQFSPYPQPPPDSAAALEDVARRWVALWCPGDLADFDALHAPDFVDHSPSGRAADRAGFRAGIVELYQAFPDFRGHVDDLVVEAATGRVAVRWSALGTHRGTFTGRAPTGQTVTFTGIEVLRVAAGRVVERWGEWDTAAIVAQLDATTATQPRHILTILAVADLDRSARFYRQAFDWPARVEVPVYVELALPDGRGLGLYRREGFAHNTGRTPAVVSDGGTTATEIYLHCADLDAAIARLDQMGAHRLSARAPRDWGDEAAYYADPDGNVLVLARPLAAPLDP